MTEEVEEKLGLAGADPYGLLELADKRWRATADELKKAYRKLVLAHHPDRKQADKEAAKEADRIKNGGDDDAPAAKENGAEKKEGDDAPTENGEGEGEGEEEDDEFKMLANAWGSSARPRSGGSSTRSTISTTTCRRRTARVPRRACRTSSASSPARSSGRPSSRR